MKELYKFTVNVETEVEKTEVKNENGQETTIKTKVKELVPYEIIMKAPARGEKDSFRLFLASQIKKAIDAGLMMKSVLVNRHIDGAGALISKETARRIADLTIQNQKLQNELVELGSVSDGDEDKKQKQISLFSTALENKRELQAIESSNHVIFQNTAEAYAEERANLWLIFNQTYYQINGKVEPLFKGANFDEKEAYFFDLEEKGDPLYLAALQRIALFWGMFSSGNVSSREDFEKLDKEYFGAATTAA